MDVGKDPRKQEQKQRRRRSSNSSSRSSRTEMSDVSPDTVDTAPSSSAPAPDTAASSSAPVPNNDLPSVVLADTAQSSSAPDVVFGSSASILPNGPLSTGAAACVNPPAAGTSRSDKRKHCDSSFWANNKEVKKKTKKKKSGSSGKTKAEPEKVPVVAEASQDDEPHHDQLTLSNESEPQDLRRELERMRNEILDQLPSAYSDRFGEVGFGRFGKSFFPAIIISPYDAPSGEPGYVRDQWMEMYEKLKYQERLQHLTYLVYWYGSDPSTCFGFVTQKDFVVYNKGQQKGYEKPYVAALKKQNDGKQLSKAEQEKVNAMMEIKEDLARNQKDRNRKKIDFNDLGNLDDSMDTTSGAEESPLPQPASTGKRKKGKGAAAEVVELKPVSKKRRRDSGGSAGVGSEVEESEKPAQSKPKKKPGRPKKTNSGSAGAGSEVKESEKSAQSKPKKKLGRPAKKMKNLFEKPEDQCIAAVSLPVADGQEKITEPQDVGDMEDFGDAEEDDSEDDQEKDEDFADDDRYDRNDEDFRKGDYDEERRKNESKLSKKPDLKKERTSRKKGGKTKAEKHKPLDPGKKEVKDYKRCQHKYGELVNRWEKAVLDKNFTAIESSLVDALGSADTFSASFLEEYVAPVLRNTKKLLKEENRPLLLAKHKELNGKIKIVYDQKKKLLPEGFALPPKLKRATPAPSVPKFVKEEPSSSPTRPVEIAMISGKQSEVVDVRDDDSRRRSSDNLKSPIARKDHSKKEAIKDEEPVVAPARKPERKTFSLGRLGQMIHREQTQESARPASNAQSLPAWLVGPCCEIVPSEDDDRSLAIQFLRDMASQFPGKIDAESTALSLEKAIFEWARSRAGKDGAAVTLAKSSWVDVYWDRVHAVVAAVCGKKESGTLMHLILSGNYATPMKVVDLREEDFRKSFDGEPLL